MVDANFFKTIVIIILFIILASLVVAVKSLVQNKDNGKSLLKALTVRITLSVLVFGVLMLGYYFNIWQPHKLIP